MIPSAILSRRPPEAYVVQRRYQFVKNLLDWCEIKAVRPFTSSQIASRYADRFYSSEGVVAWSHAYSDCKQYVDFNYAKECSPY